MLLFCPCVIGFFWFEARYLATNNHILSTEADNSSEPLEQYLLTISRSGSFIANEVADWMLDANPKDKTAPGSTGKLSDDEDEDDINSSKTSFIDDLKIVWDRKVNFLYYNVLIC